MAANIKRFSLLRYSLSQGRKSVCYNSCLQNKNIERLDSRSVRRPLGPLCCSDGGSRGFGTTLPAREMFNVQDEDDFKQKVIQSETPVVVDFHANWCGPCKVLGPRLENIIGGKGEKVHLAKIDIDSVSDLALEYGVSAVPSVLGIKDGKVVDKFVGVQEETRINAFVDRLIGE